MKVLSLFDGMACGMLAMQQAKIDVESYDAYEIDKYAITVTQHNFPMVKEHGDVFKADFTEYEGIDFLVGGSPCTYWSIAQKNNRETEASGLGWELFSQYVRALREAKPKYFVYENNKSMSKAIRESITETFGFEPICINSALVSAQNRQRLYWVGIRQPDGTYKKADIKQPEDKGILLKDILETQTGVESAIPTSDLICHNVPQIVKVRKFSCDIEELKTLLREHHIVSNKQIAEKFDKPITEVEHWFRKDKCFAVPDADVWFELKKLLNITTDKFDDYVTVFEERFGVFEKTDRCYDINGKMSTLMTAGSDNIIEQIEIITKPIRVGAMPRPNGELSTSQGMRIYAIDGKSVTQSAQGGGWGAKTGLYAVPTPSKSVNTTIYTVKDGQITIKDKQYPIKLADGNYIIRKLTVRECMRLQTIPEWYDFNCISKTQAYKCLGNGWTVDVIAHLLGGLK